MCKALFNRVQIVEHGPNTALELRHIEDDVDTELIFCT